MRRLLSGTNSTACEGAIQQESESKATKCGVLAPCHAVFVGFSHGDGDRENRAAAPVMGRRTQARYVHMFSGASTVPQVLLH